MKKLLLVALLALPMSVFAQKFAHVNSGTIIQAMPEYTTAQTELETLSKTLSDELTRMQDEFKTKYEDFENIGTQFHTWVKNNIKRMNLKDTDDYYFFIRSDFDFYSSLYLRLNSYKKQERRNK